MEVTKQDWHPIPFWQAGQFLMDEAAQLTAVGVVRAPVLAPDGRDALS